MKEAHRIFSKPRPSFKRAVESKLSSIEAIQDSEQKEQAKNKLFERLSVIHQRSTVRQKAIYSAIRNANLYASCLDDHIAAWEHRKPSTTRALLQAENQPTYGYALQMMRELKSPSFI